MKLYYNTVSPLLKQVLLELMKAAEFNEFRLVGGTALSLHLGHRLSIDIDLFTDAPYESIDFGKIDLCLKEKYPYVSTFDYGAVGFGKSYYVGNSQQESVKLDLYYTDPFIDKIKLVDEIRLATIEEIIAMKLDVISREGRKKDFWDIHELIHEFSLEAMLDLHLKRYPYSHDAELIKTNFINFEKADEDFEPNCLRHKHWELIKLDMLDFVNGK